MVLEANNPQNHASNFSVTKNDTKVIYPLITKL